MIMIKSKKTNILFQAWKTTYSKWRKLTFALENYPKEEVVSVDPQKNVRRRIASMYNLSKLSTSALDVSVVYLSTVRAL